MTMADLSACLPHGGNLDSGGLLKRVLARGLIDCPGAFFSFIGGWMDGCREYLPTREEITTTKKRIDEKTFN